MRHVHFSGANTRYEPPKGWDANQRGVEVDTIFARTMKVGETDAIMTVWVPDPEEIEKLKAGHAVVLVVLGQSMPPVNIAVSDHPLKPVANDQGVA